MRINRILAILLAITVLLFGIPYCAAAYSLSDYNSNGDKDSSGKAIVDIRDYVHVGLQYAANPAICDKEFLKSLRNVILGKEELPQDSSGGQGGSIYLPEVP